MWLVFEHSQKSKTMNFVERYRAGEYEQVWRDLQALGATVRREPYYREAWSVATETMQRVRRNCEVLVSRLRSMGYEFGVYPDGSRGYYTDGPLVLPSAALRSDCDELEAQVGPLPLSLRAFWMEVGSVDWVGNHPAWPSGLDPLVVYPPAGALSELDIEFEEEEQAQFEVSLAPDDLHKDNVSGGSPYAIALPDTTVDAILLNERHGSLFVPYLRLAILRFGGFPGLDGEKILFEPLRELTVGLEPF